MNVAERRRHLGTALLGLDAQQYRQAEAACLPLLAQDGLDLDALLMLGFAVAGRGETARAAAILDRVARERHGRPHPCTELHSILPQLSAEQIAAQFRASLRLAPADTRLHAGFADFLQESGEAASALPLLQDWLRREPDAVMAHNLMGIVQSDLGAFGAAIGCFRRAVALAPQQAAGWANLGMLLKTVGEFAPALEAYREALVRSPDDPRIRVNRAVALLQAGCWSEAWPEYEWRLRLPGYAPAVSVRLLPALSQLGSLDGRTVLVTHEDGFGDTIQFLRYLPLLACAGARVLAWVPPQLEHLVGSVIGAANVLCGDGPVPAHDYHCPFPSLPRAFETTLGTIPHEPYLSVPPALVADWAARLPPARVRVGLAWAGQARPWLPGFSAVDRRRNASLAALAPLAAIPGVQFVSLQKGPAAAEAATPPAGMQLVDPAPLLTDFAQTAGLVANLDLVISVDTAVVHLAGALGTPVFLLDRYDNCWRWLHGRADSPWYPHLTIFRQRRSGDWAEPVSRAAASLNAMLLFRDAGLGGNSTRTWQSLPHFGANSSYRIGGFDVERMGRVQPVAEIRSR